MHLVHDFLVLTCHLFGLRYVFHLSGCLVAYTLHQRNTVDHHRDFILDRLHTGLACRSELRNAVDHQRNLHSLLYDATTGVGLVATGTDEFGAMTFCHTERTHRVELSLLVAEDTVRQGLQITLHHVLVHVRSHEQGVFDLRQHTEFTGILPVVAPQ